MPHALRITDDQARILGAARFQADSSAAELAKISGCKEHVVRNTLQTMHARGLIEPIMFYNPYALGIFEYQRFFQS